MDENGQIIVKKNKLLMKKIDPNNQLKLKKCGTLDIYSNI